ncbi:MAG: hypothetical protein RMJ36_07000 [Candidatus Calescibacterium sp.]|nr:hypothetical protein [Candidatus Calescibacterium sp.]MDW8133384.1 hypothetical protein [Candidatus Calescibacterium sp.]
MTRINDFNNPIDKNFVNYFPNYLLKSQNKKEDSKVLEINDKIEDLLLINETSNVTHKNEKAIEINRKDNTSTVPINLFMEETSSIEVRNIKPQLFGPTNLPKSIDEAYINPRYL